VVVVVVDAESLSTAVMQEPTREVRQFETAFLTDVDPARSVGSAADLHRGRGAGFRRSSGAGRCSRAAYPAVGR
jgi:hypothetical protein